MISINCSMGVQWHADIADKDRQEYAVTRCIQENADITNEAHGIPLCSSMTQKHDASCQNAVTCWSGKLSLAALGSVGHMITPNSARTKEKLVDWQVFFITS